MNTKLPANPGFKAMKTLSKILSLAIASIVVATAASAATSYERNYMEAYKGRTDVPVPVSVVTPTITGMHDKARVVLSFTVDASGSPKNITVTSKVDSELSESLASAVKEWKFTPALAADGSPVAKNVVLPFMID